VVVLSGTVTRAAVGAMPLFHTVWPLSTIVPKREEGRGVASALVSALSLLSWADTGHVGVFGSSLAADMGGVGMFNSLLSVKCPYCQKNHCGLSMESTNLCGLHKDYLGE